MRRIFFILILSTWIAGVGATALAQSDDPLREGIQAYNASDFPLALTRLEAASARADRYNKSELAQCRRYLAMTYVAFDNAAQARAQFLQALSLDPSMDLDPNVTSPKIMAAFREAKEIFIKREKASAKAKPQPVSKKPSAESDGRQVAGWTLVGVGGASLLVSGVTYGLAWDSSGKYIAEKKSKSRADALKLQTLGYEYISAGALGVVLVAAGIGTYLLLTDRARSVAIDIGGKKFVVLPGPGMGFALGGRF